MPPKKKGGASSSSAGAGPSGSGARFEARNLYDVPPETWRVRTAAENSFTPKVEYGTNRFRFTIALHHGGTFAEDNYVGGVLNYIDQCTIREFNLFELSSIMLRLGYPREYICEFYYALPCNNHLCVGTEIGFPLSPLFYEEHMTLFKKLAPKGEKLIHVYALEVTVAEARVRQVRDQEVYLKEYYTPKSKGVVIEELEGPPLVVPNKRPRKKRN